MLAPRPWKSASASTVLCGAIWSGGPRCR
jgi:hypothetical protein